MKENRLAEKQAPARPADKDWIIVRGAGDLATGAVQKLWRAGFRPVLLETAEPLAIRRAVALSDAVYQGRHRVEDLTAVFCGEEEIEDVLARGEIPLLVDPEAAILKRFRPAVLVDAIIAKRNIGTRIGMGRFGTVGMGPGFEAGKDVSIVVETKRGHNLGRLIFEGFAAENTGIPGLIGGYDKERVIHAPASGTIRLVHDIGDLVKRGEVIAMIGGTAVKATLDGVLRGIIRGGLEVREGLKIADIDPRRDEQQNCFTISDKSRNLGGAVLEAVMILLRKSQA